MTQEEKLTALKAMVGSFDSDEVLSTYLSFAGSKILAKAYPYQNDVTEVPAQYAPVSYTHLTLPTILLV